MRVSSESDDPGFDPLWSEKKFDIYFNGKRVFNVITADDVTGELHVCRSELHGEKPVSVHKQKGAADLYRYRGLVDIRETA